MPSPPKGTGSFVSLEITYEIKNTEDNTKAVIIEILWALVFLFLIKINPVNNKIAVDPFNMAWKNGRELTSNHSDSICNTSGNSISNATAIGIRIDNTIISGTKNESFFFINRRFD